MSLLPVSVRKLPAASFEQCERVCMRAPRCEGFTFSRETDRAFKPCWLKMNRAKNSTSNASRGGLFDLNQYSLALQWGQTQTRSPCSGDVNVVFLSRGAANPLSALCALPQAMQ